ncbi:MAG: hypothetical protein KGL31_11655 [candidate division NC10 bacterium]|nr:hypothetical protein [candidate division NC10 bacterium]MDE2322546.1 hypothetical protein [candidate division NC10 bacterium]
MRHVISVSCAILLLVFMASQARAHGGGESMGDMDKGDACKLQKGHYTVHFTAYQEKYGASQVVTLHEVGSERVKQEFQSYCEGVPKTGKLSLSFDLYNEEMRALPITVEVVEAGEHHSGRAILSVPPTVYHDGLITLNADIPAAGHYKAIMTLNKVGPGIAHKPHSLAEPAELELVSHSHGNEPTEAELHAIDPTFTFPFTVGLKMQTGLPWYVSKLGFQAAGTMLGISALIAGATYYRNGKRKKQV